MDMSPTQPPVAGLSTAGRFITVRTVASELGVSEHTVRRWINDGVLPGVRVGGRLRVPRVYSKSSWRRTA